MGASAGFFLSPQQKFIWSSAASARSQIAVAIDGEFEEERLKGALLRVVAENEALRTVFQRQTGMKLPFQVALDTCEPVWSPLAPESGASLEQVLESEARESMPADASQLRSALTRLADGRKLWVLTAHAAIADAASMQLLVAETLAVYTGAGKRKEEALRYVQFAQWQNDLLKGEEDDAKDGARFWERVAQGAEAPAVPGEGSGKETDSAFGGVAIEVPANGVAAAIDGDLTVSDVILSAWCATIARWSGQERIAVGVVLTGREYEELAGLIGAVAKMCPLNISVKAQIPFAELASQVHAECEEIASRQEYYVPASPFKVGYEHLALSAPVLVEGTGFSTVALRSARHDCALRLNVHESGSGLRLELQYDRRSFSDAAAAEIAGSFRSLLASALGAPKQAVGSLPIITGARRKQLLDDWNRTSVAFPTSPVHALISAQSLRSRGAWAVRSGAEGLTYGELESRSNRLARYLVECGVKRGSLVGLCVSRSAAMMVPVLAILKAGGAYVPLSADQPKARTAQQLGGIRVLVTEAQFVGSLPEFAGGTVVLDGSPGPWEQLSDGAVDVEVTGDDLAYVIYTSGSTGTPKGVGVRHSNLVNYATHIVRALELDGEPLKFATVSTLAADLGNTVIYPALLTGGCLHVLPFDVATDGRRMAAYQAEHGIDVLKIVPSHLGALLDGAAGVLPKRFLIAGGEALKPALVERIRAQSGCEVVNHYGPTETTVGSLMLRLKGYDCAGMLTVPIGRPIANTRVYVLDRNRELLPVGVAGELYIAGAGVSAGYVGQAEKTAERFVADPFHAGERMYRTGDLVRWLAGGVIEFLGRADDQVKIRGYRVELGEIEAVLASVAGVRQCVVIARGRAEDGDDKQVVAYAVLDRQQGATAESLKQALKERLPDYMVPAAIVEMSKLPLTANGKVDRKALPAPEERAAREYKAPATVTEELVAQIWAEVLKVDRISTDENFFDLGGHSLLATQVVSRVREKFRLEIPLRTMFEAPVLQAFSSALDAARDNGAAAVASGPIQRVARQVYRSGTKSS